jgi:hypothetical protein
MGAAVRDAPPSVWQRVASGTAAELDSDVWPVRWVMVFQTLLVPLFLMFHPIRTAQAGATTPLPFLQSESSALC